jgi:hypothetical protein
MFASMPNTTKLGFQLYDPFVCSYSNKAMLEVKEIPAHKFKVRENKHKHSVLD